MALNDFQFLSDSVNATATLSSVAPVIEGIADLRFNMPVNDVGVCLLYYKTGLTKDCIDAKILIRQTNHFNSCGIFLHMQTAGSLTNNAYWGVLHTDSFGAAAGRAVINKTIASNANTDNVGLAHADVQFPNSGETIALGFKCEHDSTSGNMFLTLSYDRGPITIPVSSTYTFPGLASVATYLDASSPYVTGVTFGLLGRVAQNDSQYFDVFKIDTD